MTTIDKVIAVYVSTVAVCSVAGAWTFGKKMASIAYDAESSAIGAALFVPPAVVVGAIGGAALGGVAGLLFPFSLSAAAYWVYHN